MTNQDFVRGENFQKNEKRKPEVTPEVKPEMMTSSKIPVHQRNGSYYKTDQQITSGSNRKPEVTRQTGNEPFNSRLPVRDFRSNQVLQSSFHQSPNNRK